MGKLTCESFIIYYLVLHSLILLLLKSFSYYLLISLMLHGIFISSVFLLTIPAGIL